MTSITQAFEKEKAFIPFITGGDPDIETTKQIIFDLVKAGADLIEIGIPFSDPVAEGPIIEEAHARALKAGTTVDQLFDLVKEVRSKITIPILFMTYFNPIFAYGIDRFVCKCIDSGINGLIVPDLPFEERDELLIPCQSQGIELISLIAPSSIERISMIAENSSGFLYCVSSLGVTGERNEIGDSVRGMIDLAKRTNVLHCAVGFGISTLEQARDISSFADGIIVGSAIVKLIGEHGRNAREPVYEFARKMKEAMERH